MHNKGSITVEASLTFMIFTSVLLYLLVIVHIVYVDNVIQYATNQAALEMSNLSYIYNATGIKEITDKVADKSQEGKQDLATIFNTITDGANIVSDLDSNTVDPSSIENLAGNIMSIKNINPMDLIKTFPSILADGAVDSGSKVLGEVLTKKYIEDGNNFDNFKEFFHITNMNFDESQIFRDEEKKRIKVSVNYDIEYGFAFLPPIKVSINNTAITNAWLDGEGEHYE